MDCRTCPHLSRRPHTYLRWLREFTQPPTLHQDASEIAASMPLGVATTKLEDVGASMAKDSEEDVGEEADEVDEYTF